MIGVRYFKQIVAAWQYDDFVPRDFAGLDIVQRFNVILAGS